MSFAWSYGVTTVPSRFNTTLPKTLDSLANAGFESPRLFVDGLIGQSDSYLANYEITQRIPTVGAYGNWVLSLWELYIRSPQADRYAIFQDDMVTYTDLRQYLEATPYPRVGYLNLYTYPKNVQSNADGFYRPTHRGQGAVALVFSNQAVRTMLAYPHMVDRVMDSDGRGTRNIDGAVHDTMAKQGWHEYVHNPSLTQHIGDISAIGTDHNNQTLANTFRGEAFNAMALVTPQNAPKQPSEARVGLCGYLSATSLGRLNTAVVGHLKIDHWLARPHNTKGALDPNQLVNIVIDPIGSKLDKFVRRCDILVFCGRPCYTNLIEACKKYRRKVVCFRTPETLEGSVDIDLWLEVPTEWTREIIESYNKQIRDLV